MAQAIFVSSVVYLFLTIAVYMTLFVISLFHPARCCNGFNLINVGHGFVCDGCQKTYTWDQLIMLVHKKKTK